jgi:fatty acid desaturase
MVGQERELDVTKVSSKHNELGSERPITSLILAEMGKSARWTICIVGLVLGAVAIWLGSLHAFWSPDSGADSQWCETC